MARNRYGWQKRAKEIARKQKNDDKMKRRQGKALPEAEEMVEGEGWKWIACPKPIRLRPNSRLVHPSRTKRQSGRRAAFFLV